MRLADRYYKTDCISYADMEQNCRIHLPERFNFGYDIVDQYARLDPKKLALLWCNDYNEERRFTFADMKKLSDRTANYFLSLGLKKGDVVMTTIKRRYQYWPITIALCKLGITIIPATYQLTEKDVTYRVNAASVKMIISVDEPDLTDAIEASCKNCPTLSYIALLDGKKRTGWLNFDEGVSQSSDVFSLDAESLPENKDIMLIYFTSGTTGMPKMAMHDYTYPLGHAMTAQYWHQTGEDDLHITVADTGWAKCSWGKIYGQWIVGTAQFVYDMEKFDAHKLAEKLEKYKVTSFCAPPTIYRFLIKSDLSKYDLSTLKHCATAGEPLNAEVYRQFLSQFHVRIYEGCGQTEGAPIFANWKFDPPMPGSLGKPNPLYSVSLLSDNGSMCDPGEDGEICIRVGEGKPIGLFLGYYRNETLTKECWHDGWYHTGDIAWMDEDGYYWFVGRSDDVIKSSGYRIGPFEMESALLTHPAVLESAISAAPDPIRGQIVKATIVLSKGYVPSDTLKKELQNHVKNITAPYKYPRIIEFVDELPKTLSGKIKRKQLRLEAEAKVHKFQQ